MRHEHEKTTQKAVAKALERLARDIREQETFVTSTSLQIELPRDPINVQHNNLRPVIAKIELPRLYELRMSFYKTPETTKKSGRRKVRTKK